MSKQKIKVFIDGFTFLYDSYESELKNMEFTLFKGFEKKFDFYWNYRLLKKMFINGELDKYDVLHISNWFATLLVKYKKPHQVWLAHSHGFHIGLNFKKALEDSTFSMKFLGFFLGLAYHNRIKNALKKTDIFAVAIPNCLNAAKKIRKDAVWLPNPINDDFFKVPKKISGLEGNPKIFFPTRLHKMKSPELGFKIFDDILKKYPLAKLHLIRYPQRYSQYNLFKKYTDKYEKYIIWHDFIPRQEFPSYYSSFDLVLGAFGKGLLNLVELEAMACGATVVSWDKYEFIKIPLNDLSKFSLKLLSDNKYKENYVKRSKEYVKNVHGISAASKKYEQVILTALRKKQKHK